MKNWSKLLESLAGRLTAILAFAALIIIVLALIGNRIPSEYRALVYVLAIGAMLVFAYQVFVRSRGKTEIQKPVSDSSTVQPKERPTREKPNVDPLNARAKYLNSVIADTRAIRLVGIDPQAADPSRGGLTLESLYISLDTTTAVEKKSGKALSRQTIETNDEAEEKLFSLRGGETRVLGALEALFEAENRSMVLLGLPGTGKSTFARYLALRMAQAEVDKSQNIRDLLPGWKSGTALPLILSLGRMAETIPFGSQRGSAALIEEYIQETLRADERTADFSNFILAELEREGGLVLFDGLDEVADLHLRPIVVQAVEDFVQKYKKRSSSRFLVTCRTYSYYHDAKWQLTGWVTHELALLDSQKIEFFVNAWHDEHIRIEPARKPDFENKRRQLLASLQPDDRRRLHEIAPFPIILTMMAVVHTHYGELPDTRAEVYERCVDLLLVRWELERPIAGQLRQTQKRSIIDELGISRVVLDRALWEIAFKAHEGREDEKEKKRGPALVTEDLLAGVLQTHFQDLNKVKTFLEYCQSSNGLLMLQGSVTPADAPPGAPPRRVYAFPHLTFEEYLAARYLIRPNFGKLTADLVQKSDRWREVVLLLGEYLCFAQGDQERINTLIQALTPEKLPAKAEDSQWRRVWYAGDLLSLYRRAFPSETSSSEGSVKTGLQKLVSKSALSPRERASAADTLDELGYAVPDLHTFIAIPKSPITNYEFLISKYPVTNEQYERFLKRENFANRNYWVDFQKYDENSAEMKNQTWGEEAWNWLQKALKSEGYESQNDVLLPRYWRDPRFGIARRNAPVVGITWYEASAYCKWLLENWENLEEGKQGLAKPEIIRLPLDTEWAEAAGGENPKERYPWDQKGATTKTEEIVRRANVSQSGINRTTPVWMCPQGESTKGVMDMSGNVWEWQANFGDKQNRYPGLRGGSWYDYEGDARVAFRFYNLPYLRDDHFGFRVALLPSG
ncbi:MAG: SUMF1/EgtB/PvdO family nonheme iron enzyme [Anaerolineales bacterium]|nr:MAG: SUMF1/EgtB/PvdO family nonheme iron enzyme [Anaerolineales bacterium]